MVCRRWLACFPIAVTSLEVREGPAVRVVAFKVVEERVVERRARATHVGLDVGRAARV